MMPPWITPWKLSQPSVGNQFAHTPFVSSENVMRSPFRFCAPQTTQAGFSRAWLRPSVPLPFIDSQFRRRRLVSIGETSTIPDNKAGQTRMTAFRVRKMALPRGVWPSLPVLAARPT
jgi:hypothetical protein